MEIIRLGGLGGWVGGKGGGGGIGEWEWRGVTLQIRVVICRFCFLSVGWDAQTALCLGGGAAQ